MAQLRSQRRVLIGIGVALLAGLAAGLTFGLRSPASGWTTFGNEA